MKKLLAFCSVVLGSQFALAGFVAEPYLGYQMGTLKSTEVAAFGGDVATRKDKGTVVGARVGFSFLIPVVTLDYNMYSGKDDAEPTANNLKQTNLGVTVAAQMIPLLRPYAGYIVQAKNEIEGSTSTATVKGTGLKVGLGIKILPLLNINVEHAMIDYKDLEGVTGYTKVSDIYSEFKYTTTTIGLSYVF